MAEGGAGRRFVSRLAGFCERRGAILIFVVPIALVRVGLQLFFPQLQSWGDFFALGAFFVLGYLLYADERFTQAIRRDWPILLAVGTVTFVVGAAIGFSIGFEVENPANTAWELIMWAIMATCGWCWSAVMLFAGMRYLDRDSQTLRYGQEINLPFFVLHQPVLLAIAYFVVQWQLPVWVKFPFLVLSSFAVLIALAELVVKRLGFLRFLFGMKAPRPAASPAPTHPGCAAGRDRGDGSGLAVRDAGRLLCRNQRYLYHCSRSAGGPGHRSGRGVCHRL